MNSNRSQKQKSSKPKQKSQHHSKESFLQTRLATGEHSASWAWNVARQHQFTEEQRQVFFHVLACQVLKGASDWDGWVPVPWTATHRYARGADLADLVSRGLLEYRSYSHVGGRCARYRIPLGILHDYDMATAQNDLFAPRFDLFTGKVTSKARPQLYDAQRHRLPWLVRDVIDIVAPHGTFNLGAAAKHVEQLREDAASTGTEKACRRYRNDDQCLSAIWAQEPNLLSNGVGRFISPYRMACTGRLIFEGGGTMSCTRAMKGCGYSQVEGVRNYDIVSSQAVILKDMLAEGGLDTSWMDQYLAEDKAVYAKAADLSVGDWKKCIYAVLMGAYLPKPKNAHRSKGSIAEAMREAHGNDGFAKGYRALYEVIHPLGDAIETWHDLLVVNASRKSARGHDKPVFNDVGAWFDMGQPVPPHALRSQLAAHMLQGREAYIVDTLAGLAVKYGFTPITHEHDGLITIGEISAEAVAETAELTGIDTFQLEEKPNLNWSRSHHACHWRGQACW